MQSDVTSIGYLLTTWLVVKRPDAVKATRRQTTSFVLYFVSKSLTEVTERKQFQWQIISLTCKEVETSSLSIESQEKFTKAWSRFENAFE